MKSRAYETLKQAYHCNIQNVIEWKNQGRYVVGCMGSDVPEEVLIAAGILPVYVFGQPKQDPILAKRYLEKGFDPYTLSQFEQVVTGQYKMLDRLIISNSSDAMIRTYYYLRAIRKMEPHMPVPPLYFFDFLHSPYRLSGVYNRDRLKAFIREVEGWTGQEITKQMLYESIVLCNETRKLLHQLNALRQSPAPKISGTQMLELIGALMVMPREQYKQYLSDLIKEANNHAVLQGVPVFVTGSPQDHTLFYEAVEGCGAIITGEDHEMGFRHVKDLVDEKVDPIDGIVDRYHLRSPISAQATVSRRVEDLLNEVKHSNAKAVIFYIHQKHDAISWDYPSQRKALEAQGIPVLLLENQPYGLITDEVKEKLSEFINSVKGGQYVG